MDKTWFDGILINFHEGKPDEIVIRAFCDGGPSRRITVPLEAARSKYFWKVTHELALKEWASPQRMSEYGCPNCNNRRIEHHRLYNGHWFCGLCGAHYKVVDNQPILIARIEDSVVE